VKTAQIKGRKGLASGTCGDAKGHMVASFCCTVSLTGSLLPAGTLPRVGKVRGVHQQPGLHGGEWVKHSTGTQVGVSQA
jgi:hypothetical protein